MKLFFKKLTGYILFLSIFFFLLLLGLSLSNKRLLRQYKDDPAFNTLILGDSHIQNAVDDSQLPYTINLSQGLEAFVFSYAKLKIVLESHPGIKKVLLGCGYHNLSRSYERSFTGQDASAVSKRSFFLLSLKEQYWLLWLNRDKSIPFLRSSIKTGYSNVISADKDYSFIGYHIDLNIARSVNTETINKLVNEDYYSGKNLVDFSPSNIYYLNKIMGLCKSRNVELFILNTPTHPAYNGLVPDQYKDKLRSLVKGKAKLIEFNDLQLADSCFLPDGHHISGKGAAIITKYLKTILERE
jgi:hypothetical protein